MNTVMSAELVAGKVTGRRTPLPSLDLRRVAIAAPLFLSAAQPSFVMVGMTASGGMARTHLDGFCRLRRITRVEVPEPDCGEWPPKKANKLSNQQTFLTVCCS
ncbi:MAG TPA: hypothetical protein VKW08_22290 [Xanthobacteraceae bacterium]|nr:hypothetical protein [Xanthobacteraceae bacterium]